jgi:NitT/TauT family transport system ATP-binding protein
MTASPAQPIIEIRGVSKSYAADGKRLAIFDGLSCSVARGSFLSIVGPSGCGKSTLLKLISGLELPGGGQVIFDGKPISGPPKGMIYVFQQYSKSILPWRTVLQNVEFGLRSRKTLRGRAAVEKCREYIRLVGLEGYENYYPYQLSGGMQQRVVIARALICEPSVLLMDEPFSAVDAMTRAILQELLLSIWQTIPITILFVTHDMDEAVFLSSRILSLGKAPAGIADDVQNALPYPRDQITTREMPQFLSLRQQLFAGIFVQEKGEAA